MKNILKVGILSFLFLILCLGFSSCSSEECFDCKGVEENGVIVLEDLGIICEEEYDTKEEFEQTIAIFEALGGFCTKK